MLRDDWAPQGILHDIIFFLLLFFVNPAPMTSRILEVRGVLSSEGPLGIGVKKPYL